MPDIDLSSSTTPVVLILSFLTAAAFTFLFYRRTLPPVSIRWRLFLASLRFTVLFLLVYLFGEPLLSLLRTEVIRPAVVVLADNSRSMTISAGMEVADTYDRIARSPEIRKLEEAAEVLWFRFDNGLAVLDGWSEDSFRFDGDRTNITGVFEELRANPPMENLQAVILLSDGNPTSESNPVYAAEALGAPVFPIGVGDTTIQKDVLVSGVLHNSIAYVGTRVPVQVTLRSSGTEDERVEVQLSLRGSVVDRSTLTLGTGTGEYRTTLYMTPDSAGTVRGEVAVSRLRGESTFENNRSVFFVTVFSGKRTVLLLAGAPGQDVSFVRRSLEADSNIAVVTRVERLGGGFLEGDLSEELLRRSDALFLIGYPGPFTSDRSLRTLGSEEFLRKPVFFMLGRTIDRTKLERLARLIPVVVGNLASGEIQVFIATPEEVRQHPILRVGPDMVISSLPPLFQPQGRFSVRPEAQVIGTVRMQSRTLADPLLVVRSAAGRRSVALLAHGLWRWKMLSPQGGLPDSPFDQFVQNIVQWLTAVEDQRRFRVTPATRSFSALEPTSFSAEVYDESMQPVEDATVSMSIAGEGRSSSIPFVSIGNGQYEGTGDMLPPGEYSYTAVARSGEIEIGTEQGTFSVGGLEAELLETRLNKDMLRSIAFRTGGSYSEADDLHGLADRITSLSGFRIEEIESGIQVELAHSAWTLVCIIALLSIEWFLRKRLGLL